MSPDANTPVTPIDLRALERASRSLFDRDSRLVGWGSGSVFDYFHGLHPVRLDYLVDSDAARWGQRRHGIEIVDPERLAREAGPETFVIIYSGYWPEIQQTLGRMGRIASLPASAVFADLTTRARLTWAEDVAASARPRRVTRSTNAIVVQGPVVADVTARILRTMSAIHPRDLLILSTWHDTTPALLAEASSLVDEVVTSLRPEPAGIQNRNCQIVSTRAGIARARALGATTILKTRTDLAVLDPDVFPRSRWWLDRVGGGSARAAGLSDRLIVPSSFTRKYLLYHPSDLVMLGAAGDMATYWDAPLDARSGRLLDDDWIDQSLASVNMSGNPTESYLGLAFQRAIGRTATGTLSDSWAFYRDLFAVVDNDWFELLWYKNLAIPDTAVKSGVRQTLSQSAWDKLQMNPRAAAAGRADVDPGAVSLRALTGVAG